MPEMCLNVAGPTDKSSDIRILLDQEQYLPDRLGLFTSPLPERLAQLRGRGQRPEGEAESDVVQKFCWSTN